jgi:hypothetical protein
VRPPPNLPHCVGEASAPPVISKPQHSPSTPCQAAQPPRHLFPWPRRPAPPMVPRPGSVT